MDRRQALKALASALAVRGMAQQVPQAAHRQTPQVILFSQNLVEIGYSELGDIVKQMGFDGVDLTVRPGGHVEPRLANVDLVRAFEVMDGEGLSVPVITTALTTAMDRTALPVLALAGMSRVKLFRPGNWAYGSANILARLAEVQRDLAGLLNLSRQYEIAGAFHNESGDNVGTAVWDIQRVIEPLDPANAGYYFDPANATAEGGDGGWEIALRLAMPRVKAVSLQDFFWDKQNGHWQIKKCPLGQGMVDWPKFFKMLAAANYAGPLTIEAAYAAKDKPSSIVQDLQFTRKQVQTAWGVAPKT